VSRRKEREIKQENEYNNIEEKKNRTIRRGRRGEDK
jgi:hypothetical protein